MSQTTRIELDHGVVVTESPLLRVETEDRYGHVPGLPDDELASIEELERWVFLQDWGPILALPKPKRTCSIKPTRDETGDLDWGAFGTVDFLRDRRPFDRMWTEAQELRRSIRDARIMYEVLADRVKDSRKYVVLGLLRSGVIDLDQVADTDMLAMARWHLRVQELRQQLRDLFDRQQAGGGGSSPSSSSQLGCAARVSSVVE